MRRTATVIVVIAASLLLTACVRPAGVVVQPSEAAPAGAPNVVGFTLDEATDAIAEAGYTADAIDVVDNRSIFLESNWTVLEQTDADPGDTIPLLVIKAEELEGACLPTSSLVAPGVQWGFDDLGSGATVVDVAATVAADRVSAWFVGARFTDREGAVHYGLWATTLDPTTETEQAMLSANAAATEYSSYINPAGGTIDLDVEEPGAPQAIGCLFRP